MITTAVLGLVTGFATWIASLWPPLVLPDWLVNLDGTFNQVTSAISGLGAWIDWGLLVTIVGFALTVWIACVIFKVVLRVLSYLPLFGGAG